MMQNHILFNKVSEPYGWLGNMSPYAVDYAGHCFKTVEHAFQISRLGFDHDMFDALLRIKSPMALKMSIKAMRKDFIYEPLSQTDIEWMQTFLMFKFHQHPDLAKQLKETGDAVLVEDVSNRKNKGAALFWGGYLEDGKLVGENKLGQLLMQVRKHL